MGTEGMMRLFERRASREARVYAEAQARLDAGATLGDVLGEFDSEAEWLAPLLEIGHEAAAEYQSVAPDPDFSATLEQAFLAAARRPSFVPNPEPSTGWLRTALASAAVASAVAALGVLMFGLVTADQAVPGDWNYTLKITRERLEDTFTSGDQQVDVQIRQTEARVYELQRLSNRGPISAGDLEKLDREARELTEITQGRPLDEGQLARLRGIFEGASLVLEKTQEQQPELSGQVESTRRTVDEAIAATGAGPVTSITEPPPTATEDPTATEEPAATEEPEPTTTPEPTASPETSAEPATTPPPSPGAPTETATTEPTAAPTAVSSAAEAPPDLEPTE